MPRKSGSSNTGYSVEKRDRTTGKPHWRVRIWVEDENTAVRKPRVVGTYPTKTEANAAGRKAVLDRDTGALVDPTNMTIADLLTMWLKSKGGQVSNNSLADYAQVIRIHILPTLGTVPVQKLTPTRLQAQYSAWSESGLSARMIRGCHMRLSQAFDQAVQHGIVDRNPCKSVSPPKLQRTTVETWSASEVATFLRAAENRPVLNRSGDTGRRSLDPLWPLWLLLALEGMRKGEALGLRWRDVDMKRGTASIAQTVVADKSRAGQVIIQPRAKTAAGSRSVRLTDQTIVALVDHRKRQNTIRLATEDWVDHDLIVCTGRGTPINPGGNVNRSFDAIIKATKLSDGTALRRIRVHDLRHTAATLLLGAGIPTKVVSERLGHATVSITMDLYQHVTPDMQSDAAAALSDIMRKLAT